MRVERASVFIQEGADTRQTRFCLRFTTHIAAILGLRGVCKQIIHAPRPHVDVTFIWVESEPLVPIYAIQPQAKSDN